MAGKYRTSGWVAVFRGIPDLGGGSVKVRNWHTAGIAFYELTAVNPSFIVNQTLARATDR